MAEPKPIITFRLVPGTEVYRVEGKSLALVGKLVKLVPGQANLVCGRRTMGWLSLMATQRGMRVVIAGEGW